MACPPAAQGNRFDLVLDSDYHLRGSACVVEAEYEGTVGCCLVTIGCKWNLSGKGSVKWNSGGGAGARAALVAKATIEALVTV